APGWNRRAMRARVGRRRRSRIRKIDPRPLNDDDPGNPLKEAPMAKLKSAKETHVRERLGTPTDLKPEATRDISAALAGLLADVFALYMKTKTFHWHTSGPR